MARDQRTVTVSLPPRFVREVDSLARKEGRSRSELVREALRQYIARGERWDQIFSYGEKVARKAGLTPEDVTSAVKRRRRSSR